MRRQVDAWQGTLALMVLKTLEVLGPQHGYGIARRMEQTSENLLSIKHGTLYPILMKLEDQRPLQQLGLRAGERGTGDADQQGRWRGARRVLPGDAHSARRRASRHLTENG